MRREEYMKTIRARASYVAWRKHLYSFWTLSRYYRIHDYEVRRNGTCSAGCCERCNAREMP